MGFDLGTAIFNPIQSYKYGTDTVKKAEQAGISDDKLDELEDAGASDGEINKAVGKAQERNKNALLAEVSGDAPSGQGFDIGASSTRGSAQSGQDLNALLTTLTTLTALKTLTDMGTQKDHELI
ncbi:MAG TPA: hypothetical protein VEC35_14920 [Noviherbaspirillum sp.]|nr:hypothetical protein [Noviherbaspirillum sp.]